jgi:hypothetical protein
MTLPIRRGSARGKGGPTYMLNLAISSGTRSVTRTCPQTSGTPSAPAETPTRPRARPAPRPGGRPMTRSGISTKITATEMRSDATPHTATAWPVPGEPTLWSVTWLPGRALEARHER